MALGIVLISLGIVSIAFVAPRSGVAPAARRVLGARQRRDHRRSTRWSTAPARAPRATRAATSSWLIFLEGIPFLVWMSRGAGSAARSPTSRAAGAAGLVGGACSLAAYGIVLWAMTRAPVAAVAALRETSVLFAALIGALWLKEGFGLPRLAGAASVVARRRRAEALSWHRCSRLARRRRRRSCVVVGGGIAGASTAYHLAKLGVHRRRAARAGQAHLRHDVARGRARRTDCARRATRRG